jgi:hypothetical protein
LSIARLVGFANYIITLGRGQAAFAIRGQDR